MGRWEHVFESRSIAETRHRVRFSSTADGDFAAVTQLTYCGLTTAP
jgi:hypothetical protein